MQSSKRRELTERVREHSTLFQRTIVECMDTRWQIVTQARFATNPIMDTSVRPLRRTPWEEVKPTRNDV
jgi:hypothetical protein